MVSYIRAINAPLSSCGYPRDLFRSWGTEKPAHAYPLCATCHCERHRRSHAGGAVILVHAKTPNFSQFIRLLRPKEPPLAPIFPEIPPNNPQFRHHPPRRHLPLALTPAPSVPYYPAPQFQPATQARDSRPNAHFPTRRTSPKPTHLTANTTEIAAKTLPSAPIQPHDPPSCLLE